MKTYILKNMTTYTLALLFYSSGSSFASEEAPSVLDYHNHPRSPEHSVIYKGDLLSFDATLSWKDRFNGDETFNEAEVLPQQRTVVVATESDQSSKKHTMGMTMHGMGIVKWVRAEQGKVKISHGPIEKYGMPEMTMIFKVENASALEGIEEGQEVAFNVDNSSGGFVLTHIMSMKEMGTNMSDRSQTEATGEMDARGMVKAIRLSQGKIKIKHGPIDKYGMPSMTMMFQVQDAAMLEGIEPDTEVDFDIDNSAGGFEITNIKPTSQ